ncbi:hypothetical protein [uncultured Flavobacterium sp.]|uniref:hypothetical protein n=1 Tax=uncultured Flavobacterium sp. TaxID=165435 RepID=UPI0030C87747
MKHISIFLTLICLTIGQFSFACDCNSQDEFKTVAPTTEFVALVKVNKYLTYKNIYGEQIPISMEVEVVEIYKGEEKRRKITVWGGDVNICRPFLTKFKEGQHFVIAFSKVNTNSQEPTHKGEKSSDYIIEKCGERWLSVDDSKKTATNWITEDTVTYDLKELKAFFRKE